ncbi:MAG: toluene monooxygenase [Sporichthyaceae bacterium]
MALLKREDWHDITRATDWEFSYVDEAAVFPEWMTGLGATDRESWHGWREDYRSSFGEYVSTQREKDAAAYSVKAALARSDVFDELTEGWKSNAKAHFAATTLLEYLAVVSELKMARFGLTGGWRNMAVMGAMDEMRHSQIDLWFAHEHVSKDPQYDWAHKAYSTNNWVMIAARSLFDGFMALSPAVDIAVQLPFTFETGFTNLQFVALASNALSTGDVNFANMISSIQTDEARHAQQGGPTLEVLMEDQPERAQWLIDRTFWLSARIFAILTGPTMDYYTPLESREQSYREFMEEWIVDQFAHSIQDYGLKLPWYWDEFMANLETAHHSLHLGTWFYRWTLFWNPNGGISPDEREWLNSKYPTWEENWGGYWDTIIGNVNDGRTDLALPGALPWVCNMCNLPLMTTSAPNASTYPARPGFKLVHNGNPYWFCSDPCRRIWWEDRNQAMHQQSIIQRMLSGAVSPPDLPGLFAYMGLDSSEMGDDAYNFAWAAGYATPATPELGRTT